MGQQGRRMAALLVIAAASLWGSMGLFVRYMNRIGLDSLEIGAVRNLGAALIMLVYALAWRRDSLKVRISDLPYLAGSGLFSIVLFNYCYFKAISLMNLSTAAILLYTSPIFVMLLSAPLFHERITYLKMISLLIAFTGCMLVSGIAGGGTRVTGAGLLFGLGSGFGYALYSIFSRFSINRGLKSLTITLYTFFFAAVGNTLLADFGVIFQVIQEQGGQILLFFFLYASVTTVVPYLLYTKGLQATPSRAGSGLGWYF